MAEVQQIRLGWDGLTSNQYARMQARINLMGALNSHTFIFRDLEELGLEKWKKRYPRLAELPWVMECIDRNIEAWETIPDVRGRLIRWPLCCELEPPEKLEAHFVFELKARERTETEAKKELRAAFNRWCAVVRDELEPAIESVYGSGWSFPPKVSEDHFVWSALRLAGKRGKEKGFGLTIAEISGGKRHDGLDPRGVERAIRRVLSLTQ